MSYLHNVTIYNKLKDSQNSKYKYIYAGINYKTNTLLVTGLFNNVVYYKLYNIDITNLQAKPIKSTNIYYTYLKIDLEHDQITSYTAIDCNNYDPNYLFVELYVYDNKLFDSQQSIDYYLRSLL
mgnify:CR=1 FL=1